MRGYFAIGVQNIKTNMNLGTLWRSAYIFDAAYIFTIGKRFKKQASDTVKAYRQIPCYDYQAMDDFAIPYDCMLIGIELDDDAVNIKNFVHPERCIYLLGAEDNGLTAEIQERCHYIVQLPGKECMNVATAGSIIMYDRWTKNGGSDETEKLSGKEIEAATTGSWRKGRRPQG